MGAASRELSTAATEIGRPNGAATDQMVEDALSNLAWDLWGQNTPAKIAAVLRCSPRAIERYMEGKRKWSGEAVAVIVEELLRRHRMRNVRVTARK